MNHMEKYAGKKPAKSRHTLPAKAGICLQMPAKAGQPAQPSQPASQPKIGRSSSSSSRRSSRTLIRSETPQSAQASLLLLTPLAEHFPFAGMS